MIKIFLQIKDNKLEFSIRKRLNTEQKNLMNTNVINENELIFSDEYIKNNKKIVHAFIKELVNNYNIDTLLIKESSIATLIINLSSNIEELKNLILVEEILISYDIADQIIKSKNIKNVYLYNIPTYILEMLDKRGIRVDSKNEILFKSNFMEKNKLNTFSSIYYKNSVELTLPLSEEDKTDFEAFIRINKYLKRIYLNTIIRKDIDFILETLYKQKIKNTKIYIKDNIDNIEVIEYLKKINKRNSKINKISFEIDYSDEYIEKNFFNQMGINTIKMCINIIILLLTLVVVYIFISNYNSLKKVESIKNDINTIMTSDIEIKKEDEEKVINTKDENSKLVINKDLLKLKLTNSDTVGWLKVNNTEVDYPVLQAEDNDYYLKKNFNKENDASGWIFMDYRADPVNLSQNTIIFGHNMYYTGVMFGTLYKTKNADWYKKEENQIIKFNTLFDNMNWRIFSIYVIPVSNDYLIANFSSDEKYQDFIDLITNRSIYNFGVPVSTQDKILTLTTCSSNGEKRLVIHAVLEQ